MPDPSQPPDANTKQVEKQFCRLRNDFRERFGNPDFPNPFDWDSSTLKAQLEGARWPVTANLANVATARHALAIDERQRPFAAYRFEAEAVAMFEGRLQEIRFAGVHGDIGGQNRDDDRLPDIAFSWVVKNAVTQGLAVNAKRYRHQLA
jgi:uncharacterized protein (DUF2235 family)